MSVVADPRKPRGVRHGITMILKLGVCAVLAGCRSFTAVGQWAANASEQVLSALEVPALVPCESTFRRVLQRLPATNWTPRSARGWREAPNQR